MKTKLTKNDVVILEQALAALLNEKVQLYGTYYLGVKEIDKIEKNLEELKQKLILISEEN